MAKLSEECKGFPGASSPALRDNSYVLFGYPVTFPFMYLGTFRKHSLHTSGMVLRKVGRYC